MLEKCVKQIGLMKAGDWAVNICLSNPTQLASKIEAAQQYYQTVVSKAQTSKIVHKGLFASAKVEYPKGNFVTVSGRWDKEKQTLVGCEIKLNADDFILSETGFACLTTDRRKIRVSYAEKTAYIDSASDKDEKIGVYFENGVFSYRRGNTLVTSTPGGLAEKRIEGGHETIIGTYTSHDKRYDELNDMRFEIRHSLYTQAERQHQINLNDEWLR